MSPQRPAASSRPSPSLGSLCHLSAPPGQPAAGLSLAEVPGSLQIPATKNRDPNTRAKVDLNQAEQEELEFSFQTDTKAQALDTGQR